MANWAESSPDEATNYTTVLTNLRDRDKDVAKAFVADPTNPQESFFRFNRAGNKFQEYLSSVWVDKVLSIAGGGTGATSASAIRTNLGLGTMALQNSNNVNIDGGIMSGAGLAINAYMLTMGLVNQARLGSGAVGSGNLLLADNQTWVAPPQAVPAGAIVIWPIEAAPAGYFVCDGSAISRSTYSALFAVIGGRYGVGDGSTTFNLPDLRLKFPLGRAASGTYSTQGLAGGVIDHAHSIILDGNHAHVIMGHQHSTDVHSHGAGTYAAASHNHGGRTATVTLENSNVQSGSGINVTNDGIHDHVINSSTPSVSGTSGAGGGGLTSVYGPFGTEFTGNHAHGSATGVNNPPFMVITFIIKY